MIGQVVEELGRRVEELRAMEENKEKERSAIDLFHSVALVFIVSRSHMKTLRTSDVAVEESGHWRHQSSRSLHTGCASRTFDCRTSRRSGRTMESTPVRKRRGENND